MRDREIKMKFFGSLIFLFCFLNLSASPKSYLTKSEILKGEPLFLHIDLEGEGEVALTKNVFSEDGVTLEYIGLEESYSSINFKVTRKKIIKFRVLTAKAGNLRTPALSFEYNSKTISTESVSFKVKNERYVPQQLNPNSIFDQFFAGSGFPDMQDRAFANPVADDFQIHFYPSRNSVYVGESILATFVLYYRTVQNPNFQRLQQKTLEFPFFLYELLPNVNFKLPPTEFLDNQEYNVLPYNSEVYIITPIRKGRYSLGEAEFVIEGGPQSYFPALNKKSKKKNISVLDLPIPKPENFSNQVGNYTFETKFENKVGRVGEPISFQIKISGSGGNGSWKDPLKNYCEKKDCNGKIIFLREDKSKKIAKLLAGYYGFETEDVFYYSYYPEKLGEINLPSSEVSFFDPVNGKYLSSEIKFPSLKIDSPAPYIAEKIPSAFFLFWKTGLVYLIGIGFFAFAIFLTREELKKILFQYLDKISIFHNSIPEEITRIDQLLGNKKAALLRVFLNNKGIDRAKIEEIVQIKSKADSISSFYQNSNIEQKKYLKQFIKDLIQENKL
jgi:hypothetical protein